MTQGKDMNILTLTQCADNRGNFRKRSCVSLMIVLIMFALVGCSSDSGGPAPDPLAAYKSQVVDWQTCDPGILGVNIQLDGTDNNLKLMHDAQADLGDRLKCAMITVPLDHDNPARGDLKIAVMRTAAGRPALRRGAIFFNPGGPGGDGLIFAAMHGKKWNNLNPPNAIATELKKMGDQYDLIGFSPRGVGASTQLICASNEQQRMVLNDRSNQTIHNQLYNAKLIADACLKNPITPFINTDQTVRDMDLIRHLLGDKKLNYIGYSYGTWLGAWYASRFPERAGRMLLDSSMNVAGTIDDAKLMEAMGRQLALDTLLAPYAARHPEQFSLGTDPAFISTGIFRTLPNTSLWVRSKVDSYLSSQKQKDYALYTIRTGQVLNDLIAANPGATAEQLVVLIRQTRFLTDDDKNASAQRYAVELVTSPAAPPSNLILSNSDSVFNTVACNDSPSTTDEWFWIEQGNKQYLQYPFYGGSVTSNPCIYWGGPRTVKPPITNANKTGEGLLFLQSRYDTRTPAAGALNGFQQIPNASMIMVENEYSHGLFPYDTECVDLAVARYFNEGIRPERMAICNGKDASIVAKAAATARTSRDQRLEIYLDPEKDREITRIIRSMIR
jgi:pimeloyl-ACP methyl ester carboxylesterase